MLTSKELLVACNQQVGNEFGVSLQYVSIAAYFDGQTLTELAKFFYAQAEEERDHAMKFVRFVIDSGGELSVPEIPAARSGFGTASEAVKLALDSEERVTQQIYELVNIATRDSNYIAIRFLDWFVNEQFEEVTTMSGLLQVVNRAGEERLLSVEEYLAREGGVIGGSTGEEG
jgi:ferritin